MKESYRKGIARHSDLESCAGRRKAAGEALTGVHVGSVLSCEIKSSGASTSLTEAEDNIGDGGMRKPSTSPAQSETRGMRGNSMHGTREVPRTPATDGATGRSGKANSRTPDVYVGGKSDGPIVPKKQPNKGQGCCPAEDVEGRGPAEGNISQPTTVRTQSREVVTSGLWSVRRAARRDRCARFTALLHHVTVDLLREAFLALKRQAAPGVDGMKWCEYEVGLEARLVDLHDRIHSGRYRAQPSRRTYIPKSDGRMRPLGIASLEDKIVQQATVWVLEQIYETDFLGFSYGFRPGRSQHDALDALWVGLMGKKVNWVLDADIQGFFDTIVHEWLTKFIEHRIADRRILRLIRKWLQAGVTEDGKWSGTTVGTPQGAVISPLLANIYLHYVLDLWVVLWRKKQAHGDVVVVRYADDFVMGFQHRGEAERFRQDLRFRLEKFGLTLHPEKTRLIEFGRFADENRRKRGLGKPETFNFLGFSHICGKRRWSKGFIVKRKTIKKRLRAKLQSIRTALLWNRHLPIASQGRRLRGVVQGYFNYHAVPGNMAALETFRLEVVRSWLHALRRRSQRPRMPWKRFAKISDRWIPKPKILHPYPNVRFYAKHPK